MARTGPKAFISHASADAEFVKRFATDLLSTGVGAWYSGWEMVPGDSIRARLDEGLAACEIFIIVLSKASIDRPWVHTELDAAMVRKADGQVQKIIPIKIDDCGELPPILGSLLWEDFSKQPYEIAFKRVLESIFGIYARPPLGAVPERSPDEPAHFEHPAPASAPSIGGNQIDAIDSTLGNVLQVSGSPGAIINQLFHGKAEAARASHNVSRPAFALDCRQVGDPRHPRRYVFTLKNVGQTVAMNILVSDLRAWRNSEIVAVFEQIPSVANGSSVEAVYRIYEEGGYLPGTELEWLFLGDQRVSAEPYPLVVEFENLDGQRWRSEFKLKVQWITGKVTVNHERLQEIT